MIFNQIFTLSRMPRWFLGIILFLTCETRYLYSWSIQCIPDFPIYCSIVLLQSDTISKKLKKLLEKIIIFWILAFFSLFLKLLFYYSNRVLLHLIILQLLMLFQFYACCLFQRAAESLITRRITIRRISAKGVWLLVWLRSPALFLVPRYVVFICSQW